MAKAATAEAVPDHRLPSDPTPCPVCRSPRGALVYEEYGIPLRGYLLLDDPDTARGLPRGDMRLVLCGDCGYLANRAYDSARVALSDARPDRNASDPGHHVDAGTLTFRHVLECLDDPAGFLRRLRLTLTDRPAATVRAEVPESHRILDRAAFWEISYEHCGYFTTDSLAALFTVTGFVVTECGPTADGARVAVSARPTGDPDGTVAGLRPERMRTLLDGAVRFRSTVSANIIRWRRALTSFADGGRDVVLWGSGSRVTSFLSAMGPRAVAVSRVVDPDPRRHGGHLPGTGHPVVAPEELSDGPPHVVVTMDRTDRTTVTDTLRRLAIPATVLEV